MADHERVLAEVQSVTMRKTSAKGNVAVVTMCGAGGTGKTSARLAIQNRPLPITRESTRGGEGQNLVVRLRQDVMLGFEQPRGDLNHLQRALLRRLSDPSGAKAADGADSRGIAAFVSARNAHIHMAELQTQLEAMGGTLVASLVEEEDATRLWGQSDGSAGRPLSTLHDGLSLSSSHGGAKKRQARPKTIPSVRDAVASQPAAITEQIHVTRETAVVLQAQQNAAGQTMQEGVHTLFFDLGGQPEFWPLVGEFLKE
jgi:hypothetical protein